MHFDNECKTILAVNSKKIIHQNKRSKQQNGAAISNFTSDIT